MLRGYQKNSLKGHIVGCIGAGRTGADKDKLWQAITLFVLRFVILSWKAPASQQSMPGGEYGDKCVLKKKWLLLLKNVCDIFRSQNYLSCCWCGWSCFPLRGCADARFAKDPPGYPATVPKQNKWDIYSRWWDPHTTVRVEKYSRFTGARQISKKIAKLKVPPCEPLVTVHPGTGFAR